MWIGYYRVSTLRRPPVLLDQAQLNMRSDPNVGC